MNNTNLSRSSLMSAPIAVIAMLAIGIAVSPVVAGGLGNPKQFSVDMKMTAKSGENAGQAMTMKYYVGKDRLRMDMAMEGMPDGGTHLTYYDGDQVTNYMLIPQMKMYMKDVGGGEMSEEGPSLIFGSPDDADHPCKSDPEVTCKKIGADTIAGRKVDKYLVTDMEDGVETESTIWFDRELLFPVKVEDSEGVMEAVSIEIGKQPAELFEIPAGYREMSMQR